MPRWMTAMIIIVVTALVGLALLWSLQRRLVYFPSPVVGPLDELLPAGEQVELTTQDGLTLAAWFLPGDAPASGMTVAVFPGNAGNRSGRTPLGQGLAEHGHAVLLVDYRGYGGNPGRPSEPGLALDARAALAWLRDRPSVDDDRIVYFGESLGAGVAIELATHAPPLALVLRSPFTSLPDVAAVHYPWLPSSLLLRDRWPNLDRIAEVDVPILFIAGSDDTIVPPDQTRRLHQEANDHSQLVLIDGANHNDSRLGADLAVTVTAFLQDVGT